MKINVCRSFLALCISLITIQATAQTNPITKCITDQLLEKQLQSDPALKFRQNMMNQRIAGYHPSPAKVSQVLTIPVVVHVIHTNGPENISNQQIIDGIAHLNEAFANTGAYNSASGVNTNIQFCLAQQDPAGYFTNGITRTVSSLTEVTAESQDAMLKNLIVWNTTKYLNIWLVKEITSISMGPAMAGYAMFPSSHGQLFDGIVNEAALFGSSVHSSKVHIHEAGHYLGLYHTFEGGCTNTNCQTDGDKVCDTPPDNSTAPVACNGSVNTCSTDDDDVSLNNPFRPTALGGQGDQPDMFENYMDYGYQTCQTHFSNGQSTRMNAALSTERMSLLSSNGCVSACTIPIALSISANDSTVDIGTSVSFTSTTTNATTFYWEIDGVYWSATAGFNHVFNTPGDYIVSLTGSNTDASCNKTATLSIHVDCTAKAAFQMVQDPYAPGVAVTATNISQNATTYQWVVDGLPATTSTNWSQIFNGVGGHSVFLIASNSLCSDSSATSFFQVGNCNLSGVTNNWVFNGTHINFTSGTAAYAGNSPLFNPTTEGSSSISDRDGNLLFFSDGVSCWDRNKQVMPNGTGLMGHLSATQVVLITPHPGNSKQYYVFTNDAVENYFATGLRYSIVDMTLNGGLGDIIPSSKNTLLHLGGSEKITATWHANGHDIWIGTAENLSNAHYAFLIDNAGIHTTPVTSNLGVGMQQGLGSMAFSQDGNRVAECVISAWPWRILVADFNKATGQYTHPIELILSSTVNQQAFGILFSPDNSKLYVSLIGNNDILQYDLSQTTASQIMASVTAIDPYSSGFFGHLALGKDGKIYVHSYQGTMTLDAISSPNLAGAACNYQPNVVGISSYSSAMCLPNMLQGYSSAYQPSIAGPANICVGQSVNSYGILLESSSDVTVWSHTGPGTFTTQAGTNNAVLTSANTTGIDIIYVKITGLCGTSYDTLVVHTNNPELGMLSDTTFTCDSVRLFPGATFLSYQWQDASNYSTYNALTAGKYWVKMKGASGCLITDTTRVVNFPLAPAANLGADVVLCQGQIAVLQTNQTYPTYQWQDGSGNSTFSAHLPGYYTVTVTDDCGHTSTDEVQVIFTQTDLNLNYNNMDSLCQTDLPFVLNAPVGYSNYLWQDGSSASSLSITAVGTYELKATTAQGCYSTDTLWVLNCITTNLAENQSDHITLFPNPANHEITLTTNQPKKESIVNLYSAIGALVYTAHWNEQSLTIPTSQLSEGIYFIRTEEYVIKLLVQH
ncbi:MAG: M43 family zinc metalloprotease [Bacteroidota bacterium]